MRRSFTLLLLSLICLVGSARKFNSTFTDQTLRYDIKITPAGPQTGLSVDTVMMWDGWWGRRVNLQHPLYHAALTYALIDKASGDTIYADSKFLASAGPHPAYSTLLVPRPKKPALLSVTAWWDDHGVQRQWQTVIADVKTKIPKSEPKYACSWLHKADNPQDAVTIAIIGDGYTDYEMDKFRADALRVDSAFMSHPSYQYQADKLNIVAVELPSPESGISRPSQHQWVNSALHSHFDSYALDRLITIPDTRPLWDALTGLPAQQVIVICNTPQYGGSGPYNEYAIGAIDNPWSMQILVHEFGHTFANLGDEYEDGYAISYFPHIEPDEPNITTLHDFGSKWADLKERGIAGLVEGAGYQSHGVWRSAPHCLMRALPDQNFCPVCARAIIRTIHFYTK